MFTRQLFNADPSKATKTLDPAAPNYRMGDYGYGKRSVRIFQLKREGPLHTVTEYKVTSQMRMRTHKEYYHADNSDIVGSDVLETNMYVHAQKWGLRTPEEYALSFSKHIIDSFDIATESNVIVEELNWERLGEHGEQGYYRNNPHNHVFTRHTSGKRFCEVVRSREGPEPLLIAGISGLRMVKTTKAPFTGYNKGVHFYEGDMPDRILCVDLNAKWQYARLDGIDFATHWYKVRDELVRAFAGHPVEGFTTTSVQYVAYVGAKAVLDAVPEICSVSVNLHNYPHYPFDFSRFPPMGEKADVVINFAKEEPFSIGYAQVDRNQ